MKLTGILDNSLNGQLCLRGFANIKDLARVSEADYSYQRGLLNRSDISDFLVYNQIVIIAFGIIDEIK